MIERNIASLLAQRRAEERQLGLHTRVADAVARFVGSMAFVYLHLALLALWIAGRAGWGPLAGMHISAGVVGSCASIEAIFLTAFVLITQNRMRAAADRRADLDLQISLLTEHEITRTLSIVVAIADRLGLPLAQDAELQDFLTEVAPERVLEQIDRHETASDTDEQAS